MATLKEARQAYFFSQQELADCARVAKSTIIGIEHGRHRPQPRTARALARALGLAPQDIDWSAPSAGSDASDEASVPYDADSVPAPRKET